MNKIQIKEVIMYSNEHKDIINFHILYDRLATNDNTKKANLKRFAEIGFDRRKLKIHLSIDRFYFLTKVTDDIEYYKAYLKLNVDDTLEFYKTGYFQDGYITQFGNHRVKVADNIITNFYLAKREIRRDKCANLN